MMSDANKSNNQLLKPTLELECNDTNQLINKIGDDTYYTPMGVGNDYVTCLLKEKSNIHNILEVIFHTVAYGLLTNKEIGIYV